MVISGHYSVTFGKYFRCQRNHKKHDEFLRLLAAVRLLLLAYNPRTVFNFVVMHVSCTQSTQLTCFCESWACEKPHTPHTWLQLQLQSRWCRFLPNFTDFWMVQWSFLKSLPEILRRTLDNTFTSRFCLNKKFDGGNFDWVS